MSCLHYRMAVIIRQIQSAKSSYHTNSSMKQLIIILAGKKHSTHLSKRQWPSNHTIEAAIRKTSQPFSFQAHEMYHFFLDWH